MVLARTLGTVGAIVRTVGVAVCALLAVPEVRAEETQPTFNDYYVEEMLFNEVWARSGELEEAWSDLVPPACPGVAAMVREPDRLRDPANNSRFVGLRSCLLHVFHTLATPFAKDDFPKDAPMLLVWRRLDWRRFPFRRGEHWERFEKPVYLRDIARGVGVRRVNPRWARGPQKFYLTVNPISGTERTWSAYYYGRADWTGDGRADLLISWEDSGIWGANAIHRMLILVRDEPDGDVRAIDYADWFLENKERVLKAFAAAKP